MSDASGAITEVLTVSYTVTGRTGTGRFRVELIDGYTTEADIPAIIGTRLGVPASAVTVTRPTD